MNKSDIEALIDSKMKVLEEKMIRHIDKRFKEEKDNQGKQLVVSEDKLRKDVKKDMVAFVNKEVNPRLTEVIEMVHHQQIENDGDELVNQYRRRVYAAELERTGGAKRITSGDSKSGESKSDFQRTTFFFTDNDDTT